MKRFLKFLMNLCRILARMCRLLSGRKSHVKRSASYSNRKYSLQEEISNENEIPKT